MIRIRRLSTFFLKSFYKNALKIAFICFSSSCVFVIWSFGKIAYNHNCDQQKKRAKRMVFKGTPQQIIWPVTERKDEVSLESKLLSNFIYI